MPNRVPLRDMYFLRIKPKQIETRIVLKMDFKRDFGCGTRKAYVLKKLNLAHLGG